MVSHYLAKLRGHRYGDKGDMFLSCYVTSQYHGTQGSCDFFGRNASSQITILPSLCFKFSFLFSL